jgi:hypothetical protein
LVDHHPLPAGPHYDPAPLGKRGHRQLLITTAATINPHFAIEDLFLYIMPPEIFKLGVMRREPVRVDYTARLLAIALQHLLYGWISADDNRRERIEDARRSH